MKPLKRIKKELYHFINGQKIIGAHDKIKGDVSNISGDVSLIPKDARPCSINDFVEEEPNQ